MVHLSWTLASAAVLARWMKGHWQRTGQEHLPHASESGRARLNHDLPSRSSKSGSSTSPTADVAAAGSAIGALPFSAASSSGSVAIAAGPMAGYDAGQDARDGRRRTRAGDQRGGVLNSRRDKQWKSLLEIRNSQPYIKSRKVGDRRQLLASRGSYSGDAERISGSHQAPSDKASRVKIIIYQPKLLSASPPRPRHHAHSGHSIMPDVPHRLSIHQELTEPRQTRTPLPQLSAPER